MVECKTERKSICIESIINKFETSFSYDKIICRPHVDNEEQKNKKKKRFNTFSGFKAKRLNYYDVEKIEPLLHHIRKVWANDNKKYYNYILTWLSKVCKAEQTKIALFIYSEKQGVGKTVVLDFLSRFVLSHDAFCSADPDEIFEKFNSILMGKILINLNEMGSLKKDYHSYGKKFKRVVTDRDICIQRKGMDVFRHENFCNIIITTNYRFALKVEDSDRRIACFDCSDCYVGKRDYFQGLCDGVFNQECGDIFFSYMNDYHSDIELEKIPRTELKEELKDNSKPECLRFLEDIREDEYWIHRKEKNIRSLKEDISTQDLYDEYSNWCVLNGCKPKQKKCYSRGFPFKSVASNSIRKFKYSDVFP